MAASHYLNHCWLLMSEVLWHSPESNFTISECPSHFFSIMSLKMILNRNIWKKKSVDLQFHFFIQLIFGQREKQSPSLYNAILSTSPNTCSMYNQADNKNIIKPPHYWPSVRESTINLWILLTKEPKMWEAFHVMTLSCEDVIMHHVQSGTTIMRFCISWYSMHYWSNWDIT